MLYLSLFHPLQFSWWSQVTECWADGSSSKKLWLIELQCDCPESVRPAWLTPSIHPPSTSPPFISLLPRSLLHHSWPMVSVAPLRTKVRKPQPHTAVCVCSYSGYPQVLHCFVISSTSSLLLSANCCFCSTFPWDHSQSNSAVETCATCMSLDLSVTVTLTANANYTLSFVHTENTTVPAEETRGTNSVMVMWLTKAAEHGKLATCMMSWTI